MERKKQAALIKVEAKLEKAQRLHQKAHQSVEQEISDFLRATTIPNINNEVNTSRTTNASFDKRIRTLQDTKKELERKIASYHSDISRIQAGEIPHNYTSSKDIFTNIKSTAVKVAGGSLKHRSTNNNDQTITISTPNTPEQVTPFQYPESESHYHNANLSTTSITPTTIITPTSGAVNNNQNLSIQNQHSNTLEPLHSSLSSSVSNEIGNSQFYIDSTRKSS
jgi:seryl-tRNA synthetase